MKLSDAWGDELETTSTTASASISGTSCPSRRGNCIGDFMTRNPDIVCLPELPPEYTWNAEDGDFNIFRKSTLRSWVRVHSRELNEQTYRLREFGEWQSEPFANLQDLVDVTAARFWIGDLP